MTEDEAKLGSLFLPYALKRIKEARNRENFRFSYYTSASTGMSLLGGNEVWLRNAAFMNDFSEIHHGQDCIQHCWHISDAGKRLKALMTLLDVNAVSKFEADFDADQFSRTKKTYILSVSEHGDAVVNEDAYGRLSMWRAYGGKTNVAFVLNSGPFLSESNALQAYTSPVLYADKTEFERHFTAFVDSLQKDQSFLATVGWETVSAYLHWAMRNAVVSTKHPGFLEEKEWRVIYSPERDSTKRLVPELVTVDGIPQRIFKIPFKDYPEDNFTGATIPDLLNKIIVGPTEYPFEIRQAFVEKLEEIGVTDAESKVVISGIPLRRG